MSGKLRVSYAALESLSTSVTSAADDVEIGSKIEGGQGNAEIGSDVVADALSNATKQQVQRSQIAAESIRAAGKFPLSVKQSYADADAAQAQAMAAQ
ncbi:MULTISPECIES: hypothetical protein [unclassified Curtobacterium]|uniref:hypothetical protein n=1 Tax=unclassified Curtobacterium TaxID=257496 RepID=UPI0011D21E0D|nr:MULTISPECIES: hypothetical protein [unclassified Curtobacterium]